MPSATQIILDNTIKGLSDEEKYDTIWMLISGLQMYNKMTFKQFNIHIKNNLKG